MEKSDRNKAEKSHNYNKNKGENRKLNNQSKNHKMQL